MSKERLAAIFSPKERASLTMAMLEDVLNALSTSEIELSVVVSSDPAIEIITKNANVVFLREKQSGLNSALEQATKWLIKRGFNSILILPSDIPLVTSININAILELGSYEKSVVLSSSRNGGTNAFFKKPSNLVPNFFGPESFKRHVNESLSRNIEPRIYESENIKLDIDSSEDLELFFSISSNTTTKKYLGQIDRLQIST